MNDKDVKVAVRPVLESAAESDFGGIVLGVLLSPEFPGWQKTEKVICRINEILTRWRRGDRQWVERELRTLLPGEKLRVDVNLRSLLEASAHSPRANAVLGLIVGAHRPDIEPERLVREVSDAIEAFEKGDNEKAASILGSLFDPSEADEEAQPPEERRASAEDEGPEVIRLREAGS